MGIRFDQLHHPLLIVLKADMTVIYVPADMFFQLINELLLGQPVNLLRDEGLVVAKSRYHTRNKGKTLEDMTALWRKPQPTE